MLVSSKALLRLTTYLGTVASPCWHKINHHANKTWDLPLTSTLSFFSFLHAPFPFSLIHEASVILHFTPFFSHLPIKTQDSQGVLRPRVPISWVKFLSLLVVSDCFWVSSWSILSVLLTSPLMALSHPLPVPCPWLFVNIPYVITGPSWIISAKVGITFPTLATFSGCWCNCKQGYVSACLSVCDCRESGAIKTVPGKSFPGPSGPVCLCY